MQKAYTYNTVSNFQVFESLKLVFTEGTQNAAGIVLIKYTRVQIQKSYPRIHYERQTKITSTQNLRSEILEPVFKLLEPAVHESPEHFRLNTNLTLL